MYFLLLFLSIFHVKAETFKEAVSISTNFCPQLSFFSEYYKKVEKREFLRLILWPIWHTIGSERIWETWPQRF